MVIRVTSNKTISPAIDSVSTPVEQISTDIPEVEISKPVESYDQAITRLASLPQAQYFKVRQSEASILQLNLGQLDQIVKEARKQQKGQVNLPFDVIEPCLESVDPAQVLDEIKAIVLRHVVMDIEQAHATALWIAYTYFTEVVNVGPLALITAPEKACGKSQCLDVIGRLCAKPLSAANTSASSLFRAIELWSPTILMDEADTFTRNNEDLTSMINAGHTRANAFVMRVVGDNHEPKQFSVWGAKALAGIALEKHLPDPTMSRGIVIELRRKLAHEHVTRLRHADPHDFQLLSSKLARFAQDYSKQVANARPELPDALSDRAQDNWDPLLAIAQCAGEVWVARAIAAALKLSVSTDKSSNFGNELLADIREVFQIKNDSKITSVELINHLIADDEKSWATYNHGKQMTPKQLARLLNAYNIKSKTVRFGLSTPKGYEASQFTDAFARYLAPSEELPQHRNIVSPDANLDDEDPPTYVPPVYPDDRF